MDRNHRHRDRSRQHLQHPEYSFGQDGKTWAHVAAHLRIGTTVGSLVAWLAGSLIMFVTRKVTGDKAPSVARA